MTTEEYFKLYPELLIPTYMGETADKGRITVGPEFPNEGYVIVRCGNTEVRVGYSTWHQLMLSLFRPDCQSAYLRDITDLHSAFKAIACEVSQGRSGDHAVEVTSFVECATCAAKPGTPVLCAGCLQNRARIAKLEDGLAELGDHRMGCPAWGRPRPDLCTCGYVAALGLVRAREIWGDCLDDAFDRRLRSLIGGTAAEMCREVKGESARQEIPGAEGPTD